VISTVAVFPIYAQTQESLGDFTTLEAALENGTAEVHEIGAEGSAPASVPASASGNRARRGQAVRSRSDSAEVNRLVIDNKGDKQILGLAGTIVKGGKQDRQIGQDVVIGPHENVEVEAFCVEPHRWTASRNGQATGGRFSATKTLAHSKVRAAGQYKKSQGEVWSEVGKVNEAHGKEASTGTLMATLDDRELVQKRQDLGRKVVDYLDRVPVEPNVVGMAYAIEGKVRAVRWFFDRKLYHQYRETLIQTAVADGIEAEALATQAGRPPSDAACAPGAVASFVNQVDSSAKQVTETAADNTNAVQQSDSAWGNEVMFKEGKGGGKGGGAAKKKAVTRDFLAK
jgi:hypothetical protein